MSPLSIQGFGKLRESHNKTSLSFLLLAIISFTIKLAKILNQIFVYFCSTLNINSKTKIAGIARGQLIYMSFITHMNFVILGLWKVRGGYNSFLLHHD